MGMVFKKILAAVPKSSNFTIVWGTSISGSVDNNKTAIKTILKK
jgi:hypothetical protein